MSQPGPLPNARSYFTKAVVSELSVERRAGGFRFSITKRGKEPITHWISEPEAAMLGDDLQHPERFGPPYRLETTEDHPEGA